MSIPKPAAERLKPKHFFQRVVNTVTPVILPLLLAIVPTFYHYSNNVRMLTSDSFYRMLALNAVIAIVVYTVCLVFTRFRPFQAAIGASIFLVFFNTYGLLYKYLLHWDAFRMEHFTMLPLMIMAALYAIFFITRLKEPVLVSIWKNLSLVIGLIILFNLVRIVPVEIKRWQGNTAAVPVYAAQPGAAEARSPDIYYIILDEFEGFQGMRDYWKYQEVDEFAKFLKDRGFFVAEASHGSSKNTLLEVASRLNYEQYPGEEDISVYIDAITNNKVFPYLESRGYTTVVFDETSLALPAVKSIPADYVYNYGDESIPDSGIKVTGFSLDEFGELVMNNTMYYAVSAKYKKNTPAITLHNNMINFAWEHVADTNVPSPKFVYVHLLLPHPPFMYDRNGDIQLGHFTDWNYYLDNYIYSITVAEKMIDNILRHADPDNPPIILLQSDHGGRNESTVESVFLPNYPEELKTLILFATYIPGYDNSRLPQNINPINTFPIVFNYLFDAKIPLVK